MLTDSFFHQGTSHDVCEDYALHGKDYVVFSDGCSNEGVRVDSDWGARFLSKAAEQNLAYLRLDSGLGAFDRESLFWKATCDLAKFQKSIFQNLSDKCLAATLGLAYADRGVTTALLMGDGVIGARRKDGFLEVRCYNFPNNAPFYPRYLMFEGDKAAYFDKCGTTFHMTTYLIEGETVREYGEDIELSKDKPYFKHMFPHEIYDLVFVGSDGLFSFYQKVKTLTSKYTTPVPVMDVLGVLLNNLVNKDGFLNLQRDWAFKKNVPGTFVNKDWHNYDDISFAAIYS